MAGLEEVSEPSRDAPTIARRIGKRRYSDHGEIIDVALIPVKEIERSQEENRHLNSAARASATPRLTP
ncbi:MAG: hypothetical protein ABWY64_20195 [Tardiphaga sp.]